MMGWYHSLITLELCHQRLWKTKHMALFGLFGRKKLGYSSPWLQLTVVYATSPSGLEPVHKFAVRGKVLTSGPIEFEYIEPGSYVAFFPGTAAGLALGNQLADDLRVIAQDKAVPNFGVGVQQGECLAQLRGTGRFVAKPAGKVISQALALAIEEANAHA